MSNKDKQRINSRRCVLDDAPKFNFSTCIKMKLTPPKLRMIFFPVTLHLRVSLLLFSLLHTATVFSDIELIVHDLLQLFLLFAPDLYVVADEITERIKQCMCMRFIFKCKSRKRGNHAGHMSNSSQVAQTHRCECKSRTDQMSGNPSGCQRMR